MNDFWLDLRREFKGTVVATRYPRADDAQGPLPWNWFLDGQDSETKNFRHRATTAAVGGLKYPESPFAWSVWLEHLRLAGYATVSLVENGVTRTQTEVCTIEDANQASDDYCLRLYGAALPPQIEIGTTLVEFGAAASHSGKHENTVKVEEYITECAARGIPVTKTDIWKELGYTDRSAFQDWAKGQGSHQINERMKKFLRDKPHLRRRM